MVRAHGVANDWVTAGSRLRLDLCAGLNVQSGHREWAEIVVRSHFGSRLLDLDLRAVLAWDVAH